MSASPNTMTVIVHLNGLGAVIDGPRPTGSNKDSGAFVSIDVVHGDGVLSLFARDPEPLEHLRDVFDSAAKKIRAYLAEQDRNRAGGPRAEVIDILAALKGKAGGPDNAA